MFYHVTGIFRFDKAHEFMQKLIDGTIESQKPDGLEIIRAMKSATINDKGVVTWTEQCFCPVPLMHERETFYDFYFTELKTRVITKHEITEGISFLDKCYASIQNSGNKRYS